MPLLTNLPYAPVVAETSTRTAPEDLWKGSARPKVNVYASTARVCSWPGAACLLWSARRIKADIAMDRPYGCWRPKPVIHAVLREARNLTLAVATTNHR